MSLKNYKNNKFEYKQPLTYDSLNNLNYNDIILNNEIEPMAKGVLAFKETTDYDPLRNVFTPNSSTSDDVIDKYKLFQNIENDTWQNMSVTFTTKDVRLTKLSFFTSAFRVQNLPAGGVTAGRARLAFFISTNNSKIEFLNSTYKTSGMVVEPTPPLFRRYGTISMNYICVLPAGTHKVFVGVKSHNCTASILESDSSSRVRRPSQLFVEDLGFPFRSGEDFQYEFQD